MASCLKAEKAALNLIARAEQTKFGLTAKLKRKGFETMVVKTVVSDLLERSLLDDSRYSELWLRSRLAQNRIKSPLEVMISLGRKGVERASSLEAIKKVLDEETEYNLLLKYIEKFPDTSRNQLKAEGFSTEAINNYFESV